MRKIVIFNGGYKQIQGWFWALDERWMAGERFSRILGVDWSAYLGIFQSALVPLPVHERRQKCWFTFKNGSFFQAAFFSDHEHIAVYRLLNFVTRLTGNFYKTIEKSIELKKAKTNPKKSKTQSKPQLEKSKKNAKKKQTPIQTSIRKKQKKHKKAKPKAKKSNKNAKKKSKLFVFTVFRFFFAFFSLFFRFFFAFFSFFFRFFSAFFSLFFRFFFAFFSRFFPRVSYIFEGPGHQVTWERKRTKNNAKTKAEKKQKQSKKKSKNKAKKAKKKWKQIVCFFLLLVLLFFCFFFAFF